MWDTSGSRPKQPTLPACILVPSPESHSSAGPCARPRSSHPCSPGGVARERRRGDEGWEGVEGEGVERGWREEGWEGMEGGGSGEEEWEGMEERGVGEVEKNFSSQTFQNFLQA